eukprot:Sspe_Gene.25640::Locus_10351_Transcript_1_1_Confidence_1.000_Length_6821::g.25640::m.25640
MVGSAMHSVAALVVLVGWGVAALDPARLRGWYRFEEDRDAVLDHSDSGADCVRVGKVDRTGGWVGFAATAWPPFPTNASHIQCPPWSTYIQQGAAAFTASLWVRRFEGTLDPATDEVLLTAAGSMRLVVRGVGEVKLETPTAECSFAVSTSAHSSPSLVPMRWVHLAVTVSPDATTLYADGEGVASCPPIVFPSSAAPLILLGTADGGTFKGSVDELRLYDTWTNRLGVDALRRDRPASVPDPPGALIAQWTFDTQDDASRLLDVSGHNRDAVAVPPVGTPGLLSPPEALSGGVSLEVGNATWEATVPPLWKAFAVWVRGRGPPARLLATSGGGVVEIGADDEVVVGTACRVAAPYIHAGWVHVAVEWSHSVHIDGISSPCRGGLGAGGTVWIGGGVVSIDDLRLYTSSLPAFTPYLPYRLTDPLMHLTPLRDTSGNSLHPTGVANLVHGAVKLGSLRTPRIHTPFPSLSFWLSASPPATEASVVAMEDTLQLSITGGGGLLLSTSRGMCVANGTFSSWFHVAVVTSPTTDTIFLEGEQVAMCPASVPSSPAPPVKGSIVYLGNPALPNCTAPIRCLGDAFEGFVKDFAVYESPLSAGRIASLARHVPEVLNHPVWYVDFTGGVAADRSPLHHPPGVLRGNAAVVWAGREEVLQVEQGGWVALPPGHLYSHLFHHGITVAAWLRLRPVTAQEHTIFAVGDLFKVVVEEKGALRVEAANATCRAAGLHIGVMRWRHVVWTHSLHRGTVYIDGVEEGACHVSSVFPWLGEMVMGRIEGDLDDFRLYASMLSPEQVMAVYGLYLPRGRGVGKDIDLLVHYTFDTDELTHSRNQRGQVRDHSGNRMHGVWWGPPAGGLVPGVRGNAVHLTDGAVVRIGIDPVLLRHGMAVAAWIAKGFTGVLLSSEAIEVTVSPSDVTFRVGSSNLVAPLPPVPSASPPLWHHVAAVWRGHGPRPRQSLYWDGVPIGAIRGPGGVWNTGGTLEVRGVGSLDDFILARGGAPNASRWVADVIRGGTEAVTSLSCNWPEALYGGGREWWVAGVDELHHPLRIPDQHAPQTWEMPYGTAAHLLGDTAALVDGTNAYVFRRLDGRGGVFWRAQRLPFVSLQPAVAQRLARQDNDTDVIQVTFARPFPVSGLTVGGTPSFTLAHGVAEDHDAKPIWEDYRRDGRLHRFELGRAASQDFAVGIPAAKYLRLGVPPGVTSVDVEVHVEVPTAARDVVVTGTHIYVVGEEAVVVWERKGDGAHRVARLDHRFTAFAARKQGVVAASNTTLYSFRPSGSVSGLLRLTQHVVGLAVSDDGEVAVAVEGSALVLYRLLPSILRGEAIDLPCLGPLIAVTNAAPRTLYAVHVGCAEVVHQYHVVGKSFVSVGTARLTSPITHLDASHGGLCVWTADGLKLLGGGQEWGSPPYQFAGDGMAHPVPVPRTALLPRSAPGYSIKEGRVVWTPGGMKTGSMITTMGGHLVASGKGGRTPAAPLRCIGAGERGLVWDGAWQVSKPFSPTVNATTAVPKNGTQGCHRTGGLHPPVAFPYLSSATSVSLWAKDRGNGTLVLRCDRFSVNFQGDLVLTLDGEEHHHPGILPTTTWRHYTVDIVRGVFTVDREVVYRGVVPSSHLGVCHSGAFVQELLVWDEDTLLLADGCLPSLLAVAMSPDCRRGYAATSHTVEVYEEGRHVHTVKGGGGVALVGEEVLVTASAEGTVRVQSTGAAVHLKGCTNPSLAAEGQGVAVLCDALVALLHVSSSGVPALRWARWIPPSNPTPPTPPPRPPPLPPLNATLMTIGVLRGEATFIGSELPSAVCSSHDGYVVCTVNGHACPVSAVWAEGAALIAIRLRGGEMTVWVGQAAKRTCPYPNPPPPAPVHLLLDVSSQGRLYYEALLDEAVEEAMRDWMPREYIVLYEYPDCTGEWLLVPFGHRETTCEHCWDDCLKHRPAIRGVRVVGEQGSVAVGYRGEDVRSVGCIEVAHPVYAGGGLDVAGCAGQCESLPYFMLQGGLCFCGDAITGSCNNSAAYQQRAACNGQIPPADVPMFHATPSDGCLALPSSPRHLRFVPAEAPPVSPRSVALAGGYVVVGEGGEAAVFHNGEVRQVLVPPLPTDTFAVSLWGGEGGRLVATVAEVCGGQATGAVVEYATWGIGVSLTQILLPPANPNTTWLWRHAELTSAGDLLVLDEGGKVLQYPQQCECHGHGRCSEDLGKCICTKGFDADQNCKACKKGTRWDGELCVTADCTQTNPPCSGHGECGHNGRCVCRAGFHGRLCEK